MGKIGKQAKIVDLTPCSCETVCRTKQLTGDRKLPGPRTTTCSEHYLFAVPPFLGCRLVWVRCLFDTLQFEVFLGQMTRNRKNFEHLLDTFWGDIDSRVVANCARWKSTVEKLSSRLDDRNKPAARNLSEPPPLIWPTGSIASDISWTYSPLDLFICTEFGPDWLRFAGVILKRFIFGPPNWLQYRLKACTALSLQ